MGDELRAGGVFVRRYVSYRYVSVSDTDAKRTLCLVCIFLDPPRGNQTSQFT